MISRFAYEPNAYFTVEAAIVFPIVLSTVLFVIYTMFFQYDRCLLEQDIGVIALRGAAMQINDKEILADEIEEQAVQINYNKYLIWENGEMSLKLEGYKLCIMGNGQISHPFNSFEMGGYKLWRAETSFKNDRVNPISFIRICRKLTGGN